MSSYALFPKSESLGSTSKQKIRPLGHNPLDPCAITFAICHIDLIVTMKIHQRINLFTSSTRTRKSTLYCEPILQ